MKPALRGTCRVSMAIRPPRLCRILDISCIQLCLQNEAQYFETQTCIASTLAQPQHSKLDMTMLTQTRMPALAGTGRPSVWVPARNPVARSNKLLARAADGPKETSTGGDSYSKIEAPVRGTIPDQGPPVSERNWGQDVLNPQLKSDEFNPDKKILGTEVGLADSFRFAGAIPEVANSRLAMLGFVLAVVGEATTGRNVFQQVAHAPLAVASVFLTFIVATAVPVVRGVPRKGNSIFSSDAEIINGRTAMLGFTGLVLLTFYTGSYLGTLGSWFS